MSKPVVYISGPMTGYVDFNFPAFNAAADKVRALGYPCVNPADFGADPSKSWRDCLVRDIGMLTACDVVVKLNGHSKSKGSKLEVHIAKELGLYVIGIDEFLRDAARPEPRKFDPVSYTSEESDRKSKAAEVWLNNFRKPDRDRAAKEQEEIDRDFTEQLKHIEA